MTATAWDNVTANTIKNCWIKTGILPSSDDDAEIILSELEENSQRDNRQIQHSIDRLLGNDNNVSASDFLSIDDKILSIEYEESTDQEIVDCILGKDTEVEADEISGVTNKEVIECLEKLQNYLVQENNTSISFEWIRQLDNIKNNILNILCLKKYRRSWSSTSTSTLITRNRYTIFPNCPSISLLLASDINLTNM